MSTGLQVLSDSVGHNGMAIGLASNPLDSDPNVPAGYKAANATNGHRTTSWRILQAWGGTSPWWRLQLDPTHPRYSVMSMTGIGVAGHSFKRAGVYKLKYQTSPNDTSWTTIASWGQLSTLFSAGDFDVIFILGPAFIQPYVRVILYFNDAETGTIAGDLDIGEIFIGRIRDFGKNPSGVAGVDRRLVFPSAQAKAEGGGRSAIARGDPEEAIALSFRNDDDAALAKLRNAHADARGPVRPMLMHTHYHTGAQDYRTDLPMTGFAVAIAGAWFGRWAEDGLQTGENAFGYETRLSFIRDLKESEV
ncbi:MAG: hypothetical protein A2V88_00690 [Elusimicrobia bacterium RBG_16_66_12]|nr:MAG: hypothetical protein A2V88_00690 [Elusimicrobia bacterium RBG_16_66_12]